MAVIGAFALVALAATVYLVYMLEILKFRSLRERQQRRRAALNGGEPTRTRLHDTIEREIETGEFESVGRD